MNVYYSFTMSQRNALARRAGAFWPSVCRAHHRLFAGVCGPSANNFREKRLSLQDVTVNVFLTLTAVTKW